MASRSVENPHPLDLTEGRQHAAPAEDSGTAGTTPCALAADRRVPGVPRVRPDDTWPDARTTPRALTTPRRRLGLTDLLVGEVKVQLLSGRIDWAHCFPRPRKAKSSRVAGTLAFRPLRPLFRAEAAELEPLLARGDTLLDDCGSTWRGSRRLRERWETRWRRFLGLDEIGDEARGQGLRMRSPRWKATPPSTA